MRLSKLINESLIEFLLEAEKKEKTIIDTYKQINALKRKYNFDPTLSLRDNYFIPVEYQEKILNIIIEHCTFLNKEIFNYIKTKYDPYIIYWKKSKSTISQYVYFKLIKGDQLLGIRISDHKKTSIDDKEDNSNSKYEKPKIMNVFYVTLFTDELKEKIDKFIKNNS